DMSTLIAQTSKPALLTLTVKANGTPLTLNDDYSVDMQTGEIRFKTSHSNLTATFDYADPSKVTENDIKGGIESSTGARKG
ncbi:hypothetical protein, partial [Chryseobacterium gambrini]|uniref:hypothetical protein n=1 Tax=Chryseobacterium gambrini TaxID=373672 RepID=UPI0025B476B3